MGKTLSIAGGVVLGGWGLLIGYGTLDALADISAKNELENHQTIKGVVVDESFTSRHLDENYQVSIMINPEKKVVVYFSDGMSDIYEPRSLNTLFAKGDSVELEVATNKEFDGNQRYVGLTGKLIEK